jgi:hypothetical protein
MNDGTGFAAFALYNSLKLHFYSASYDYFKYNGKTNVTKTSFSIRKDKYSFYKLSRKYSLEELKQFYIANFLEGDKWVGEMTNAEGEDTYKKWQKIQQSLTYTFENDIMYLLEFGCDELLKVRNGDYPLLLTKTTQKFTKLETLCILNDILGFLPDWDKKISDDVIWPTHKRLIERYTPFIQYDKKKFKQILKEKIHEQATN